jgi:hypothetical protein
MVRPSGSVSSPDANSIAHHVEERTDKTSGKTHKVTVIDDPIQIEGQAPVKHHTANINKDGKSHKVVVIDDPMTIQGKAQAKDTEVNRATSHGKAVQRWAAQPPKTTES